MSASFVTSVTEAAPTTKTILDAEPLNAQPDPLLDKTLMHDRVPNHEIQIGVGYLGGNLLEGDEWRQGPLFSFRYSPLHGERLPTWDFQAEFDKGNIIGLFAGRRWYLAEAEYLPYLRLAGGSFFDSKGEIGNLVEIKRWRVRSSVGFGDRLNLEVGFGFAVTGPDLFALLGYNFDF
ncbi:MAG TPA: hypothetical protein VN132_10945 [Bdellovibrio sp.]|nr:hypothetical protein [Bdellovibrio sp.]